MAGLDICFSSIEVESTEEYGTYTSGYRCIAAPSTSCRVQWGNWPVHTKRPPKQDKRHGISRVWQDKSWGPPSPTIDLSPSDSDPSNVQGRPTD